MTDAIVVPQLCIRVVTGDAADDPHGQSFSAIFAEIETTDERLTGSLTIAKREGRVIMLRCAMLDVVGLLAKFTSEGGGAKFVLAIEDLRYRKPEDRLEKRVKPRRST